MVTSWWTVPEQWDWRIDDNITQDAERFHRDQSAVVEVQRPTQTNHNWVHRLCNT